MAANGTTPTAEANPGITFRQYMTDVKEEVEDLVARVSAAESDITGKASLAGPDFTGNPTAPTQTTGSNNTRLATTAFVQTEIAAKAPLASPALTGTPTAPTQGVGNNSTRIATTEHVHLHRAELEAQIAAKADLASPSLTGNPTAPTQGAGNSSTRIATTEYVTTAVATKAPLASPALTGNPTAPTRAYGSNTTDIATTAFVERRASDFWVVGDQKFRPGNNPYLYSTALSGAPEDTFSSRLSTMRRDIEGRVIPVVGEQDIVTHGTFAIERGRIYKVRWKFRRKVDTPDTNNAAVHLGVVWLDRFDNQIGTPSIIHIVEDLTVASGEVAREANISTTAGTSIDEVPPGLAVSCRLLFRTFGEDTDTSLITMAWLDITEMRFGVYPNLSSLEGRVGTLESIDAGSRLGALESSLDAPDVQTYATVAAATAAEPLLSVSGIRTLGYYAPFDGGGADYLLVDEVLEGLERAHIETVDGRIFRLAASPIRLEMLGAAGDGIEADEQAVQSAVTAAVEFGVTVVGHGFYRITAPVVIPSNFHFDGGNSAQFIKDFASTGGNADAMFVNEDYGVLAADGDISNVSIRNVLLKTEDSTSTSALISFVNVNGLELDNVRTEKTSQGWSIHLSGQNIQIRGVRPTSEGPGTNIDGLHFNWVKNLTIDGIIADTEDDCIAFTADPTTWTGSGPVGLVAQNIAISNCVLRSKAGGLRIGNGVISSGEAGADEVDPDLAFRKVVVSNTLIEKTDATGSLLALEDRRSNANAKHTEISFVNCRFRMTGAARLVNLLGNNDPADAAKTWRNYGSIEFKGCYFECGIGELFAGAASSSVGGAFDVLRLLDCWIVRLTETAVDNSFNLRNFGAVEVRNLRFRDKLNGPRAFYLREYDRIFMSDIFYENESTGSDAAAFLAPDNPKAGAMVVLEGVVVNGDVQYRLQGVSAVTIPSLYLSGGAAKTTVGDIASNVSYTAGEIYGQRTYVTIADDSVYIFRPPGNFGRLNITSQLSGADGEVQYRTSAYPSLGVSATLVRDGGSLTASTSVLAGTTGTAEKLNIAPDASGNIRIENRLGSSVNVTYFVSPFGNVTA